MKRHAIFVAAIFAFVATDDLWAADKLGVKAEQVQMAASERVLEELLPVSAKEDAKGSRHLRAVLSSSAKADGPALASLANWLEQHPKDRWASRVGVNLGKYYRERGYGARALKAYRAAWDSSKSDASAKAIADEALEHSLRETAYLSEAKPLQDLVIEAKKRPLMGAAAREREHAMQVLDALKTSPETTWRCGIVAFQDLQAKVRPAKKKRYILGKVPVGGFNLKELAELGSREGLALAPIKKVAGHELALPAIYLLKAGHYVAALEQDALSVLVKDAVLGNARWMLKAALEDESTQFALIPAQQALPSGWAKADAAEQQENRGRGVISEFYRQRNQCRGINKPAGGCEPGIGTPKGCGDKGMPVAGIDFNLTALTLQDTPLAYTPPKGPPVAFTLNYHDTAYEPNSPIDSGRVGQNWTHSWRSIYFEEQDFTCFKWYTGSYPEWASNCAPEPPHEKAFLERGGGWDDPEKVVLSGNAQAASRQLPGGWTETYESAFDDFSVLRDFNCNNEECTVQVKHEWHRRVMRLSSVRDPQGNALTFAYGAHGLETVTDAVGQVTHLYYEDSRFPDHVTRVEDPFGRHALMSYDALGRLASVTDAENMTSRFTYDPIAQDKVLTMTTPYGPTTFDRESGILVTDPAGRQQKAQFISYHDATGSRPVWDDSVLPAGSSIEATGNQSMLASDAYWTVRNVFYWDEKAMAMGPDQPETATVYHFLHIGYVTLGNLLESVKRPFENRVFYDYPGGVHAAFEEEDDDAMPLHSGTVLEDGSTQITTTEYNSHYRLTRFVDPLQRETRYVYAANGEDLLFVKDKNDQVLASYEYNGPPHRPTKVTDAGGKATLLGYNAAGQVTSVQLPTGETTAFQYDSQGFMEAIIPPAPGSRVDFTKDNVGRIATSSDAVNGTLAYSYDKLDRLRKVTYPDNTTEETAYDRLDVDYVVDRNNLKTDYTFNAVRQLTDVIDPKNQRTQLTWCDCGALSTLIDPKNQLTEWRYDVAGRLTAKIYPDTTRVTYEYEARKSRLKRVTDAMQQQTNYVYDKADALTRTYYTQAKHATPAVDFEYDPLYGRLTKMTDGTGVTHFGYLPIPAGHGGGKGAGRLGSVDGPLVDDTITYGYDDSGRVLSTAVNGVAETLVLDANGRLQNVVNPLGTFTYAYDPTNGLLNEITRPGGKTAFDYYPSADLQNRGRLQAIRHLNNAQQVLDRFAYGYDPGGRITGWEQQRGSDPAKRWTLGYDLASQLETAVLAPVGGGAAITNQAWHYDLAGNRDQQTVDGHITDYSLPNQLNQLAKVSPKGPTHFEGQLNQAAQVQVDGQPATVDSQNRFRSAVTLQSSLQDVSVAASTAGGQVLTQVYQVVRDQELSYDLNGNMTSDGTQQYGWDAANRLLSVADAQKHTLSEFTYDGLWRRVRMVEKQGLTTAADRKFIWAGARPIEERNQSNNVEKRFYGSGVQVVQGPLSGAYLYSRDHLGSIRSVLDGTGNQVAAYDYDLWGNRTQTAGTFAADFGYAGYFEHAPSGLKLTWFRGYSPLLGRWISRDPLGEFGGTNLYGYVDNASVSDIDMFGLLKKEVVPTYLIENTQELIDRITGSSLSKPEMERATNAIISAMTPMDLISGKATSLGGIDPSSKEITLTPQQLAYIEELLRRIGKSDSELSKRLKDELKKAIKKGSIRVACPPATPTPGPAQPYRGW